MWRSGEALDYLPTRSHHHTVESIYTREKATEDYLHSFR
jgi:hypothetical protein